MNTQKRQQAEQSPTGNRYACDAEAHDADLRALPLSTDLEEEFSIGYVEAQRLLDLANTEGEREAIRRLSYFQGTAVDIGIASRLYERNGNRKAAADIRHMLSDY